MQLDGWETRAGSGSIATPETPPGGRGRTPAKKIKSRQTDTDLPCRLASPYERVFRMRVHERRLRPQPHFVPRRTPRAAVTRRIGCTAIPACARVLFHVTPGRTSFDRNVYRVNVTEILQRFGRTRLTMKTYSMVKSAPSTSQRPAGSSVLRRRKPLTGPLAGDLIPFPCVPCLGACT